MRKLHLLVMAAVASTGMVAVLTAQTAPSAAAAPRQSRGPRLPHTTGPDLDSRFGAPYSNAAPSPFIATPTGGNVQAVSAFMTKQAAAAYPDKASWEKRADFVRNQILVANGLVPMPPKTPLNPVIHSKIDKGDFTIENVYFASLPGHYVTGNLYRPKNIPPGTKVPAILHPYGHWPNGRFWWRDQNGITKEMTAKSEKSVQGALSPLQATNMNFASMGCVVFEWDLVGFGDSTTIEHQKGFTDAEAVARLQSFVGLQTWNAIRAFDFISSLPEVDTTRIAVGGSSGGGTQTMQLGAVEPRLALVFPIVMSSMHVQGGCVCENAPLLRVGTNNVEISALAAPRFQGDCGATGDNTADFAVNGLPQIKQIYKVLGFPDNVESWTIPFPHNHNVVSRELFYNFINKSFKLGIAGTITEKPIDPIPVKQLSVWNAEHPMPADFGNASVVRAYMTKSSDDQLAALEKNLPEYRATLLAGLQGMIVDEFPSAQDIETSTALTATGSLQRGFLSRRGAEEHIPFAFLKPANFNGTVVIWADPTGVDALADASGKLSATATQITTAGALLLAIDPFDSPNFKRPTPFPVLAGRTPYAGYTLGYERSTLANRVHDLLTAISLAHGTFGVKSIRILATADAAPQALLAAALSGRAVSTVASDLNGFDFDKVTDANDPNFTPGSLKYGGIYGFTPLLGGGDAQAKVLLVGARESGKFALASHLPGVTVDKAQRTPAELAKWIIAN